MISVIIPTYKGSKYLSRAIESVLIQDGVDFEVIVVDDNDPESIERTKTEKVMEKYQNNIKVKYIKHKKNLNGSTARNSGIKEAIGDYISFLDDDDFYYPNRLKKCLDNLKHNNFDIVYTDVIIIKHNIISGYINALLEGNLFKELLLDSNLFGTGSNLFIKKNLIEKNGGFDESLLRHQDYEFLLRQFAHGATVASINECLVAKAMNDTNNTVNYEKLKDIKDKMFISFQQYIDCLEEKDRIHFLICQHKELLNKALIENNKAGISEQRDSLKELGYAFSLKDRLKEIIISSKLRPVIQKMVWNLRSFRIKRKNKEASRYALENI